MASAAPVFHLNKDSFTLSPIKAMELAVAKIPGAISLAQGIPSFSTPEVIKDFVRERLNEGVCDRYSLTVGLSELREEIAHHLKTSEGLSYDPDSEIIVTVGSIEGITASILALTQPGDEVLIPSPSYVSYQGSIGLARCQAKFFELDEDNNFDFNVEKIAAAITRSTRVILFCSPNNPTGTLFSKEKTEQLVKLATKHNIHIVIDEVYKDFYYTNDRHFTACSIPEARDRIIRVCSFSKAYAMTGWRVGFLHADRALVQKILKYHDAMVTCAPVISQYAALAAFRYGDEALRGFKDEFRRRRNYTIERLDRMSNFLDYQLPKATYFVFPRIKDSFPLARDSRAFAYDMLNTSKVAVVPGVAFGPSGESHFRISYGKEFAQLEEGLTRIEDYLTKKISSRHSSVAVQPPPTQEASAYQAAPVIQRSSIGTLRELILGAAARRVLSRNRPIIIGICGSRGKTVYKRTVAELLSKKLRVRTNPLSYNTKIGLPLSILNLPLPKSSFEQLTFLLKLAQRALLGDCNCQVLILEYGFSDLSSAQALLNVATPDWLLITGTSPLEPHIPSSGFFDGLKLLASSVKPGHAILPVTSSTESRDLFDDLSQITLVDVEQTKTHGVALTAGGDNVPIKRDVVSESAWGALAAGLCLGKELGLSPEALRSFITG